MKSSLPGRAHCPLPCFLRAPLAGRREAEEGADTEFGGRLGFPSLNVRTLQEAADESRGIEEEEEKGHEPWSAEHIMTVPQALKLRGPCGAKVRAEEEVEEVEVEGAGKE